MPTNVQSHARWDAITAKEKGHQRVNLMETLLTACDQTSNCL